MQTMNCDIDYILVGGGSETKQQSAAVQEISQECIK